jgi:hypothetical protein
MNPCKGYMHEGTHDFQTNGKNNLDDSVKAKWRVKLSPTQTLRRHDANAASSRRKYCAVTTQTLHHHDANTAPSRRKRSTVTTQTLHRHDANTTPSQRKRCIAFRKGISLHRHDTCFVSLECR